MSKRKQVLYVMCYDGLNGYENCPAGFVDDFQDGLDNQDSHQDGGPKIFLRSENCWTTLQILQSVVLCM